jgi:hypothetical protein
MAIFTMAEGTKKIQIGYDITRMEDELVRLSEQRKKLKFKSDRLRKQDKISMKVKDMKLNLSVQKDEGVAVVKKSPEHLEKEPGNKIEA